MPWKGYCGSCLILVFLGFLAQSNARGQGQTLAIERPFADQSGYLVKWDPIHTVMVFYRDQSDRTIPAVRAYAGAKRPGPPVHPLQDFPDAKGIDIWNVAGAPGGGVVVAAVVQYGGQRVRHVLLTYDSTSKLRKMWEVYPYHHHQIVADRDGNVFAFGHREDRDEEAGEPDYALLIKYSPDAKVLWESAPRSWFPYGAEVVSTNASTGEHQMLLVDGALVLYVSTTKEMFWFDPDDGHLIRRVPMSYVLEQMGGADHRAELTCLAATTRKDFLGLLRLWPRNPKAASLAFRIVEIAPDAASWRSGSQSGPVSNRGFFLGLDADDKAMFLRSRPDGQLSLTYDRP